MMRHRGWRTWCLAAALAGAAGASTGRAADEPATGAAIQQELRAFLQVGTVLHVAAHPDDENTQLITYLSRGKGLRTAYLSVTRGDGGQNLLGGEFGEELGLIRTEELLAARRLDGGEQFFTRAIDFGFSKDFKDALAIWDRQEVLADVVRVMRTFRPDVVITRFSPEPSTTHGHHTASAVLALEAFKLAGDPKAFPEQLTTLTPWQPTRIVMNGGGGGGGMRMEVGGTDPVLGTSFADIAARSRAMHKTQGFGNAGGGGGRGGGGGGARTEAFTLLAGAPATGDVFEGIDLTWGRVPNGAPVGAAAEEVLKAFDPAAPAASVPGLLAVRAKLAAVGDDPLVAYKRRQLDHLLQSCLGLTVKTQAAAAEVVPGEPMRLRHEAAVASAVPVKWVGVRYPAGGGAAAETGAVALTSGRPAVREVTKTLPPGTPPSQPYWLRQEPLPGTFRVADPALIGRPENPPAFPVEQVFEVGGQTLVIPDEPIAVETKDGKDRPRRLDVIAAVALKFSSEVRVWSPNSTKPVEIEVTGFRPGAAGTLQLDLPAGWKAEPATAPIRLAAVGDKATVKFMVTSPASPTPAAAATITAHADVDGGRYATGRKEIRYDHVPVLLLQPQARMKAVNGEVAIRGKNVGYLPGAGDGVAECLQEMGYAVTTLGGDDLTAEKLKGFDAVVTGVRAFNTRTDLAPHMQALFDFAEAGGTVVVQYNRPDGLKSDKFAPYPLRLSTSRITDERAATTLLAADHPALTTPNKIGPADFDGWVQERGIYFPTQWDEHFTPLLAWSDPGEQPLNGGLLVARHGKGYIVYTGVVFFRELPAGVPGAYRLFANLVSLGK
jgi:LmbE family N-acetylglucosaminyl deacetylase